MIKNRDVIIFLITILLFGAFAKKTDKDTSHGWVSTRESWFCFSHTLNVHEAHSSCYLNQAKYLEKLINKKLYPNNPYGKHNLSWWLEEKNRINKECIREAINFQKNNYGLSEDNKYDEQDVYICQSNMYSDINRSLVDYSIPVR
jgi:hypothetical protein